MKYGLIGQHLSHSKSPLIHAALGAYPYELCELEPNQLDAFFSAADFRGINVTIPYKRAAVRYCDSLSENARRIGCVNTVIKRDDNTLYGDNTDYNGLLQTFKSLGADVRGKYALILGSGGASLTARAALADLGADRVVTISRTGADNYDNIKRHENADIIINTTPVGMYPDTNCAPVDLSVFTKLQAVIDLIYNPLETMLLQQARSLGIKCANGLSMLAYQAYYSALLFTGADIPASCAEEAARRVRRGMENIIFIGMPGCGKSTYGRKAAAALRRRFYDTDAMIVEKEGREVVDIFAAEGEEYFRRAEEEVIADVCRRTGAVISIGGGAVMREKNRAAMRQNGFIVFLQRDPESLCRAGRPLSADGAAVRRLYEQRLSVYRELCDAEIELNDDINMNYFKIMRYFNDRL